MSATDLAQQIEKLVEAFIASGRAAASTAVNRAFASAAAGEKQRVRRPDGAKREPSGRRSSEDIGALSERLYAAICAQPGEGMASLAPVVGVPARALHLPMKQLKTAGRIRSVGQRQGMRYFPMARGTGSRAS